MMEFKNCNISELKFHDTNPDAMQFEGYGAVFGNMDAMGDVIQPGAFADTLSESQKSGNWPAMLLQHGGGGMFGGGDDTPIGLWTSMAEDPKGLRVEGKLADTPRGREVYTLMKMDPRPAITGLSIGYRVKEFTRRTKPEEPRRTLKKIDLIEISPVTFPANGKARIDAIKSIDDLDGPAEIETILRDAGFSRKEAKHLMAKIRGENLRDADDTDDQTLRDADLFDELAQTLKLNSQILGGKNA